MKNLRVIFILFFLAACTAEGMAQRFRAGLIAGLTASDVAGFNLKSYTANFRKGGFTFGGYVNARVSDQNSWQFEISYMRKGTVQHYVDTAGNTTYFYQLRLNYIEVPVLFRHQFHIQVRSVETERFALEIGPSLGALVNIYQDGFFYEGGGYYASYFNDEDFKRVELALHGGVSYNFADNFYFNVRYSNSIIPVTRHKINFDQFFRYTWNKGDNMVFSFSLRYLFGTPQTVE